LRGATLVVPNGPEEGFAMRAKSPYAAKTSIAVASAVVSTALIAGIAVIAHDAIEGVVRVSTTGLLAGKDTRSTIEYNADVNTRSAIAAHLVPSTAAGQRRDTSTVCSAAGSVDTPTVLDREVDIPGKPSVRGIDRRSRGVRTRTYD
jgi:hypothetical protein